MLCSEGASDSQKITQPTLHQMAKALGKRQLAARLDLAVTNFFCANGVPINVADSPEWREIFAIANPKYTPASRTTIEDSHIPAEAAVIRLKQLNILKKESNLTITFDGGSTRSTQSNLTIHIITEDRRVFFVEGRNSTGFAHTSDYYYTCLKEVRSRIIMIIYARASLTSNSCRISRRSGRRTSVVLDRTIQAILHLLGRRSMRTIHGFSLHRMPVIAFTVSVEIYVIWNTSSQYVLAKSIYVIKL